MDTSEARCMGFLGDRSMGFLRARIYGWKF